jgi:Holliday junction resolvase
MNKFEREIADKWEKRGWRAVRSGWPDLLLTREEQGKTFLMAVEVKTEKDPVRNNQKETLSLLARVIPTVIERRGCAPLDVNYLSQQWSLEKSAIEREMERCLCSYAAYEKELNERQWELYQKWEIEHGW